MKKLGLGLQMYSVRNEMNRDEWKTICRVAEIGYHEVELCAPDFENGKLITSHSPAETKNRYADLGLRLLSIAMPVNFHMNIDDWKQLTEYSSEIGCEAICCSVATFSSFDSIRYLADFFNRVGETAAEHGQRFFYHNHYHEFKKVDGKSILQLLVENTDPSYVDFELDTFWALRGGVDPIACMNKLGDRLKLVHQKDLSPDIRPINLFDDIPDNQELNWDTFVRYANHPEAFCEIGRGVMDVRGIVEKAKAMPNVYSIIIEQDFSGIGELESAAVNFENIKKMIV